MALYYPMMERTHVANQLRTMGIKESETLEWALDRGNKLDIGTLLFEFPPAQGRDLNRSPRSCRFVPLIVV